MENVKFRSLQVGDTVTFDGGNFSGLSGEVTEVDWNSKNPNAIYGLYHAVKLSDGRIGHIEKSEHIGAITRESPQG